MTQVKGHLISVDPAPGVRVVLAAADRRFLHVTSFLLARKGFLIEAVAKPEQLVSVVEHHRPDVVILDGTDSLTMMAQAIGAIEALPYPVAVLVVAEAPEIASAKTVRLLHKWTSFDRLLDEVQSLSAAVREPKEVLHGGS